MSKAKKFFMDYMVVILFVFSMLNCSYAFNISNQTASLVRNVELIRVSLGRFSSISQPITVKNPQVDNLYYMALSTYEKVNRLTYEITGTFVELKNIKEHTATMDDVSYVVQQAITRLELVKKHLNIRSLSKTNRIHSLNNSEIFNALLNINRQLSLLMYQRIGPNDVYAKLMLAINLNEQFLRALDVKNRIPDMPEFIANKTPRNVFENILSCLDDLTKLASKSHIQTFSVQENINNTYIYPSIVINLVDIYIIKIRHIMQQLKINYQTMPIYNPGYMTPSNVYQLSGILKRQIKIMQEQCAKHKDCLAYFKGVDQNA